MTQTVFGTALTELGHASDGTRSWSTPAELLRTVQDERIQVDIEHRGVGCGKVIFIERRGGAVWLVAEVDDAVAPEVHVLVGTEQRSVPVPLYWSVARIGSADDGYLLTSASLTSRPARVNAVPVEFRAGNANLAAYHSSSASERHLLKRAAEYDLRRHGAPLTVRNASHFEQRGRSLDTLDAAERIALLEDQHYERKAEQRPHGQLQWRPSVITNVR